MFASGGKKNRPEAGRFTVYKNETAILAIQIYGKNLNQRSVRQKNHINANTKHTAHTPQDVSDSSIRIVLPSVISSRSVNGNDINKVPHRFLTKGRRSSRSIRKSIIFSSITRQIPISSISKADRQFNAAVAMHIR